MMKYLFSFILFCYSVGLAQPQIPKLKMWATDLTNTLTKSELNELNIRLRTYQDTTSNQILVLMIPSLEGYPIEMLAEETATQNKIGTEKNDNGILLLIAKDDRELRIEVGYGLEGAVPDAIASSIIRNVIRPRFRDDYYYQGINEGINAIISAIGGEYKAVDADEDDGFPISMSWYQSPGLGSKINICSSIGRLTWISLNNNSALIGFSVTIRRGKPSFREIQRCPSSPEKEKHSSPSMI